MKLTEKETMLLQDLKKQEQVCIDKYGQYAGTAGDASLKRLFKEIGSVERNHLNTINNILEGKAISAGSKSKSTKSQSANAKQTQTQSAKQTAKQTKMEQNAKSSTTVKAKSKTWENDKFLCNDLLATEKYVSSCYNTSVFECAQPALRNALNHIQKEEQEHGKLLYDYMNTNGMYN